jgi:hypothetical protein
MPEYEICLWDDDADDRQCRSSELLSKIAGLEKELEGLNKERNTYRKAFLDIGIHIVQGRSTNEEMIDVFLKMKEKIGDDGQREFRWTSTDNLLPDNMEQLVLVSYSLECHQSVGVVLASEVVLNPKRYSYWAPMPRPMME